MANEPKTGNGRGMMRYWGTYLKSLRHAGVIAADFRPLVKRGWRCFLVLTHLPDDKSWLKEYEELGVTILCAPRPKGQFDRACIRRTAKWIRENKIEVFHCDNTHTSPLLGAFFGGAKVRVWSKLDMEPAFKQLRPFSFKERVGLSNRLSCFLCDRVIAVSSAVRDEMVSLGIPEKKFIVRNTPRIYAPSSQSSPAQVRAQWNFTEQNIVMLTLGRCIPVKAWDLLLEAFAAVVEEVPEARLVMLGSYQAPGEQPFYNQLLEIIREMRLEGKVHFAGFVSDVQAALKASDIFVMPSLSEGASYALIEGLDAHLPCVVSDVGNAREVIREGENGHIIPRNDPVALARALLPLAHDRELRQRMSSQSKAPDHILDMYECAEQFAMDYEALLAGKPVPIYPDRKAISVSR